jgi:hypothetical protein
MVRLLVNPISGGAIHAEMSGRIGVQAPFRNLITAFGTIAELATIHPAQSASNTAYLRLALAIGSKRHLLSLHRIHPRQSADTLLVELDGVATLSAGFAKCEQLTEHALQARPKPVIPRLIRDCHVRLVRGRSQARLIQIENRSHDAGEQTAGISGPPVHIRH